MFFEYPYFTGVFIFIILIYFYIILKIFHDQNKQHMEQAIAIAGAVITLLILRWIIKDD